MSKRTIVCQIGADWSLKMSPQDAEFLGLRKGGSVVMNVHRDDANPGAGMHVTIDVVDGGGAAKREPRAFKA